LQQNAASLVIKNSCHFRQVLDLLDVENRASCLRAARACLELTIGPIASNGMKEEMTITEKREMD